MDFQDEDKVIEVERGHPDFNPTIERIQRYINEVLMKKDENYGENGEINWDRIKSELPIYFTWVDVQRAKKAIEKLKTKQK